MYNAVVWDREDMGNDVGSGTGRTWVLKWDWDRENMDNEVLWDREDMGNKVGSGTGRKWVLKWGVGQREYA